MYYQFSSGVVVTVLLLTLSAICSLFSKERAEGSRRKETYISSTAKCWACEPYLVSIIGIMVAALYGLLIWDHRPYAQIALLSGVICCLGVLTRGKRPIQNISLLNIGYTLALLSLIGIALTTCVYLLHWMWTVFAAVASGKAP